MDYDPKPAAEAWLSANRHLLSDAATNPEFYLKHAFQMGWFDRFGKEMADDAKKAAKARRIRTRLRVVGPGLLATCGLLMWVAHLFPSGALIGLFLAMLGLMTFVGGMVASVFVGLDWIGVLSIGGD